MRTHRTKSPLALLGVTALLTIAGLWGVAGAVVLADAGAVRGQAAAPPTETSDESDEWTPSHPHEDRPADPRFDNCASANEAGYGYYWMGEDPEYYWYDDEDGNGVACEQ
ncbi:excalibur calcium-binding domain-containing protein [Phytomonospora sp. NPDC050363]|uniref:excalibur calcium-binding domain-containing protein n=1 Tax=Phytomonospora sp. NPDC050363 TaxID=3155642 RepID=UPI0033CC5021